MFFDFNDSENQSRFRTTRGATVPTILVTEFGSQVDALCRAAPTVVGTTAMAGAVVSCCETAKTHFFRF